MNLIKLNVKIGLDNQIYYKKLLKDLKRDIATVKFDNTDLIRTRGFQKVKKIKKVLDGREDIIKKFDDELFSQMMKKVKVISFLEVEFVYKRCVRVKEYYRWG